MVEFTNEEIEYLLNKKEDKFGGYSAFLGMVLNQAIQEKRDPMELLKEAVVFSMKVDKMIEKYKEKVKENVPQF